VNIPIIGSPVLVARLRVTNALGLFDSLDPKPFAEQVRIKATVTKNLESAPNKATIDLYNLSDIMTDLIRGVVRRRVEFSALERAQLMLAGASTIPVEITSDGFGLASIELSWGYADSASMLLIPALKTGFVGQSTNMHVAPEGNDKVLRIEAEDSGHLLGAAEVVQIAGGVVPLANKSYLAGTDVVDIMVDFINAMGVAVSKPILAAAVATEFLARGLPAAETKVGLGGYNASGSARDQLERFLKVLNIRWSIQDGQFLVLNGAGVALGYEPLVLSTALGNIVGEPERGEGTTLGISTFADADARPGRQTTVATDLIQAAYRIDQAVTSIDTYSGGSTKLQLDELLTIAGVF
jgi:hypothetical protein